MAICWWIEYGNLLWWTPHPVITKSMKSKKKERRKLTGCFLLCVGQELCWVNVFFFSLLASLFNWGRIMLESFFHQKEEEEEEEEEDTRKEIKKVLKNKNKK